MFMHPLFFKLGSEKFVIYCKLKIFIPLPLDSVYSNTLLL